MGESLIRAAQTMMERTRAWRRYLHANPELSGEEHATAAYLGEQLRRIGLDPQVGVGGTCGLVTDIGAGDGPTVALRADMDALPIHEETGLDFASRRTSVMHACGHDAHMAMLLTAAAMLHERRDQLRHPVRLIFQPHEEKYPGGAAPMVAAGVLANVESVFGLHIWSRLPTGTLGIRRGPFMSSVNDLHIVIRGKGGHAAMPELCVDPVVIAAQAIVALQTVVSRAIALTDSAVVSVTRVEAGTADNVIPETTTLRGTIRTLSEPVRVRVCEQVRALVEGIARAAGGTAEVNLLPGYPVLVNDQAVVDRVLQAARALGWPDDQVTTPDPQGGGEDFAYYAEKVPAAFAFLGGRNEAIGCSYPHHHPRFNIDENALPLGAALLAQYALSASAG